MLPALSLAALAGLLSPPAAAQALDLADEAEVNFRLGVEAYLAGRYSEALARLLHSYRLSPNPNVAFNIARAYEKLGEYGQAYRYYRHVAQTAESEDRRAQAERSIEALRGRVALLEVRTEPPGAAIYLDRENLGQRGVSPLVLAVEPGEHTIIADLAGHAGARSQPLMIRQGEIVEVVLSLPPILAPMELVGSPAGAEVRLEGPDGPVLGQLPAAIEMPVGDHVLYVSAPGHAPLHQQVTIEEGRTTRAAVNLPPITGRVVVDASEPGALVQIDDEAMGFTPVILDRVPAGEHTLRITRPGFVPYEAPIEVPAEDEIRIDVPLRLRQEVTAASRSAESITDAPASVSLITAQEIRAFGYQSVWEAAGTVRGLYQTDDLTYQFLGIRGFSTAGDYGNRILVSVDGHTYNDDLIGASYPDEAQMTDLLSVEQIEIVRGPGSALYGSNAFFGVINAQTWERADTPPGHVSVAAVRDGQVRARVGGGSADADRGAWAAASGAYGQGRDYDFSAQAVGYFGESAPLYSYDNDRLYAGTMMARGWLGDLELQLHHSARRKQIPTGAFETILGDERAYSTDARSFAELRWEPRLSDSLSFLGRAYLDRYTFDGAFPYEEEEGGLVQERWEGLWTGVEPRLLLATERLRATAGAEARVQLQGQFTGEQAGDLYLDEELLYQVYSAYAEVGFDPAGWVTLSAGGRLDAFSTFGLAASPRLAAVLHPSPDDTLKLLGGQAYRAPSVYQQTYNDGGITQVPSQDLSPEIIQTIEAEYTRKLGERLSAVGDVFYNQFYNLIDVGETEDGLYQYQNTGETVHSAGFEAELRRDWRGGRFLSAAYSFQRTRYGSLGSEVIPTNSPAHRAVLKAAAPAFAGVRAASLARIESGRLTAAEDGETWTDGALLWDLTLTGDLDDGALRWSAGVRNLLDWDYAYPGGYDLWQPEVPARGRNAFLEVTRDF